MCRAIMWDQVNAWTWWSQWSFPTLMILWSRLVHCISSLRVPWGTDSCRENNDTLAGHWFVFFLKDTICTGDYSDPKHHFVLSHTWYRGAESPVVPLLGLHLLHHMNTTPSWYIQVSVSFSLSFNSPKPPLRRNMNTELCGRTIFYFHVILVHRGCCFCSFVGPGGSTWMRKTQKFGNFFPFILC